MKRIGIIGNYSQGEKSANGQSIKTRILTNVIREVFKDNEVITCDTSIARGKTLNFIGSFIKTFLLSKTIIILPAQKAAGVIIPLLSAVKSCMRINVHYYVVGGWLVDALRDNQRLLKAIKKLDGVYVELHSMEHELISLDLKNVFYVYKFSGKVPFDNIRYSNNLKYPIKLCYFSRISKEKGIEDAINAIEQVNNTLGMLVYTLDVYGKVDDAYSNGFNALLEKKENYVKYHGVVEYNNSNAVLSEYVAMLFPTYYSGEGYPNVIVDAFLAGIPVIANDWKYNREILSVGVDSLLYDRNIENSLSNLLIELSNNIAAFQKLQEGAAKKAKDYSPTSAVVSLVSNLDGEIHE